MIKLSPYINKLITLPLPSRRECELLIKEIYNKGREDERRLSNMKQYGVYIKKQ